MRKGLLILIAIGVCALMQVSVTAQSVNPLPAAAAASNELATSLAASAVSPLTAADLKTRLDEAKVMLKSQANLAGGNTVVLAVLNPKTSLIELVSMSKTSFLTKGLTLSTTSQSGHAVNVTIVRANGVNTAVRATDPSTGTELLPLTVAFPIVKGGSVTEIAYYSSAHPAVLTSDVATAGETYISTMLDRATHELAENGVHVSPDIVEVAEHLCVVEHTDHKRFMTEAHAGLLPEITSLYALNQGNTFRYSVSTAGAGGMIQMIPRTYEGVRQQHPSVSLQADFVAGMRDHANALKAMLLYMNDTWTNLAANSEVQDALRDGIATKPELLAAGYNSNPVRLPIYLKNGGANWKTLIPAETQMYLQIYSEVDRNVKFTSATATNSNAPVTTVALVANPRPIGVAGWISLLLGRIL
jgi:hypothetical protein